MIFFFTNKFLTTKKVLFTIDANKKRVILKLPFILMFYEHQNNYYLLLYI